MLRLGTPPRKLSGGADLSGRPIMGEPLDDLWERAEADAAKVAPVLESNR